MNPFQLRNWRSGTNWHFKGNFWLWKEKKLDFAWSEFGHCSSLELKLWKVKFLRVATGVKDSKTQGLTAEAPYFIKMWSLFISCSLLRLRLSGCGLTF